MVAAWQSCRSTEVDRPQAFPGPMRSSPASGKDRVGAMVGKITLSALTGALMRKSPPVKGLGRQLGPHYRVVAAHCPATFSSIDKRGMVGENPPMSTAPIRQSDPTATPPPDIPDRSCTWCKVLMMKRLVAGGQFIHYTCPQCIFQHTTKHVLH